MIYHRLKCMMTVIKVRLTPVPRTFFNTSLPTNTCSVRRFASCTPVSSHVMCVLRPHIAHLFLHDVKPMRDFAIDIVIGPSPIERAYAPGFELWVALVESLGPFWAWWLYLVVARQGVGIGIAPALDDRRQAPKHLDRQWVSITSLMQHVLHKSLLFTRSKILLLDCAFLASATAILVTPEGLRRLASLCGPCSITCTFNDRLFRRCRLGLGQRISLQMPLASVTRD